MEVLRGHMVAWIEAARTDPATDQEGAGETTALVDAFRAAGLPDLAAYACSPAPREGPIPHECWLFSTLLGRACAVDLVNGLKVGVWRKPHLLGLQAFGAWDAFLAELTELIASNEWSRVSFWAAVSEVVDTMAADPGAFAWGRVEVKNSLRAAVDDYRAKPSLKEAWETRLDSHVWLEHSFIFDIARQLDAARLFGLAERLPHPVFLRLGLGEADAVNEHEIARLLMLAQPAFDPAGVFQSVGMIAAHLLSKASLRLRWLCGDGQVFDAPCNAEDEARIVSDMERATAGLEVILDALFSRRDATFIGWAWLERLVFEGEHRGCWRPRHHVGEGRYVDAWIIVVHGLAQRLGTRTDALSWTLAQKPLWRSNRMTAVLASVIFSELPDRAAIAMLLRSMLMSVEPPYSGAARAVSGSGSPLAKIGCDCVLSLDEPSTFLASTWQDLRPYRERAWRGRNRADETAGNPAEILVLWALYALEKAPPGSAAELSRTVKAMLCDAFQTDAQGAVRAFWLAATERFSRIFGATRPEGADEVRADVVEFLRPYLRDDEYVVRISMALHKSGVSASIIIASLNSFGFDLTEAVCEFIENEAKAGVYHSHNPLWIGELAKAFCSATASAAPHARVKA
ncbi:hypothetical protein [Methylobacterium sp. Leaf85]|uniref:hypothetical protein n=1 Tax=Methylobacterium sp. Leaf85 TaxID=1736241 RepID=UPI0006F32537|nr:hypothetical protein [Methylobacterium sp. Leaf85]KQO52218.1 hypothetical protein ASF08_21730 [Methylobacterium sp. Leaf85]